MNKITIVCCVFLTCTIQAVTITSITSKKELNAAVDTKKPVVLIVSTKSCGSCITLKRWLGGESFNGITFLAAGHKDVKSFGLPRITAAPTIFGYKAGKQSFIKKGFSLNAKRNMKNLINGLK